MGRSSSRRQTAFLMSLVVAAICVQASLILLWVGDVPSWIYAVLAVITLVALASNVYAKVELDKHVDRQAAERALLAAARSIEQTLAEKDLSSAQRLLMSGAQAEYLKRSERLGYLGAPRRDAMGSIGGLNYIEVRGADHPHGTAPLGVASALADATTAAVAAAIAAVERHQPRFNPWISMTYVLVLGVAVGGLGAWLLLTSTDDTAKGVGGALMGAAAAFVLRDLHEFTRRK